MKKYRLSDDLRSVPEGDELAKLPGTLGYLRRCWMKFSAANIMRTIQDELTTPEVPVYVSRFVYRAKVQSVTATAVKIKMLDASGTEIGSELDAYPVTKLDSGNLNTLYPASILTGKVIPVFLDIDGKWYTTQFFDSQTT
jgi:hypothetical protein